MTMPVTKPMTMPIHERVSAFIRSKLSELTELPESDIDCDVDLAFFGMDSLTAAMLTEELNLHLRQDVVDYSDMVAVSTINDVAALVASRFRE